MKIIAKGQNEFIVTATPNELAQLIGHSYATNDVASMLVIGANINVTAMFNKLYVMKDKAAALKKHAKELRELADAIETKVVPIQQIEP